MSLYVIIPTELFLADLALERLESTVNSVDVSLEFACFSKVLPTLTTLVGLQFFVNCLNVFVKIMF